VFRTRDYAKIATITVGKLPHGIWPSGDGTRVYVGLEADDRLVAIDTLTNTVTANIPIGQAPQAVVYVPNAVPSGDGRQGLQALGVAGQTTTLTLVASSHRDLAGATAPTSVTLYEQGLVQVLQASVTGLEPRRSYVLAISERPDGSGALQPLSVFTTNPAGSAIVNAVGPIRQIVKGDAGTQPRRYLVIAPGITPPFGNPVQIQADAAQ
jgi:YVTN family beta-propeller protein